MVDKPKIIVYHAKQCDPKKCTSLKLKRLHQILLIKKIKDIPSKAIFLNPLSKTAFSPKDRGVIQKFGLVALDCSWKYAKQILLSNLSKTSHCLPFLIAGNPVNFGKPTKLSTVEALAAALYIAGFKARSLNLLSKFKWGPTFLTLNSIRLEKYAKAKNSTEIIQFQTEFIEDLV